MKVTKFLLNLIINSTSQLIEDKNPMEYAEQLSNAIMDARQDIMVSAADISLCKDGTVIRKILDETAKKLESSKHKAIIIYGLEGKDEHDLCVGLGEFSAYVNEPSYGNSSFSFNPNGFSIFVVAKENSVNHFFKFTLQKYGFQVFNSETYLEEC